MSSRAAEAQRWIASLRSREMKFDGQVLRQGTWLYANEVVCDIRIVRHDWRYGTADYEDPPDVREDCKESFFICSSAHP